ncbi:MAG: IS607 family transposase [Thermaerobacter sp.]|jgi:predicted site-specific integrase-resolvase|nr:IS607 family transposase [Thermaerobacter sp.]
MKLSQWAKEQGVSYRTAWRWFRDGKLPVAAEQLPTGTILVKEARPAANTAAIYARVSSTDQAGDLDRQVARVAEHLNAQGIAVIRTVREVGSGLNGHRPKLLRLLADPKLSMVAVEHRDRLMRFGAEYVEAALAAQGRKLLVVDPEEMKDDLVQDMIDVLTSFYARLYGRGSARNRAKRAVAVAAEGALGDAGDVSGENSR